MFFTEQMTRYINEKRNNENEYPYQNHVRKFVNYINIIDKDNKPKAVHADDISNCIGYYRNLGQIRTISTMLLHLEVIKDFYTFLHEKELTPNIILVEIMNNFESYKNDLIRKHNIIQKRETDFFDNEEISSLLFDVENIIRGYQKNASYKNISTVDRKKYALCIFIKLSLLAPAKKSCIFNLKLNEFINDFSLVKINNIVIKTPNSLRRDIKYAITDINESNISLIKVLAPGISLTDLNTYFCSMLKRSNFDFGIEEDSTSYSIQKIVDSAIKVTLEAGANPVVLSTIAGIKISAIEKKFGGNIDIIDINSIYNTYISKCFYYTYL